MIITLSGSGIAIDGAVEGATDGALLFVGPDGVLAQTVIDGLVKSTLSGPVEAIPGVDYVVPGAAGPVADLEMTGTLFFQGFTDASILRTMASIDSVWEYNGDPSYRGRLVLAAYDWMDTPREGMRIEGDGGAARIGFFGVPAVGQQIGDLVGALVNYGLITSPIISSPTFTVPITYLNVLGDVFATLNAAPDINSLTFSAQNQIYFKHLDGSAIQVNAGTLVATGNISCPGTGASSEHFGAGSSAVGHDSIAIGNGAGVSAPYAVAIGAGASAGGTTGAIAIGWNVSTTGNSAVVIGYGANGAADGTIAIGQSSRTYATSEIAIGQGATTAGGHSLAIGVGATAMVNTGIAIGNSSNAGGAQSLAVGYGARTTAGNQAVFGSTSYGYSQFVVVGDASGVSWISQGMSSTSTVRAMGSMNAAWADNTDATRRGRLSLFASDYTGANREGLRIESDGTAPRVFIVCPPTAPLDVEEPSNSIHFYLDSTNKKLSVRVRFNDGTYATGSINLI